MIAVEDNDPEEHQPTPDQATAFRYLLDNQVAIRNSILHEVFPKYPEWRSIYASDHDLEEDESALSNVLPALNNPAELSKVMGLSTLHVSPIAHAGQAYLGFEFGCPWEEEHGLGVLTHAGRVAAVGHADVCFLDWVAERDARKQQKEKR
jgi:hypothetical protein